MGRQEPQGPQVDFGGSGDVTILVVSHVYVHVPYQIMHLMCHLLFINYTSVKLF